MYAQNPEMAIRSSRIWMEADPTDDAAIQTLDAQLAQRLPAAVRRGPRPCLAIGWRRHGNWQGSSQAQAGVGWQIVQPGARRAVVMQSLQQLGGARGQLGMFVRYLAKHLLQRLQLCCRGGLAEQSLQRLSRCAGDGVYSALWMQALQCDRQGARAEVDQAAGQLKDQGGAGGGHGIIRGNGPGQVSGSG